MLGFCIFIELAPGSDRIRNPPAQSPNVVRYFMKISSTLRAISITSYFFIFLQGMIIQLPFVCLLFSGILEGETLSRVLVFCADISLVTLLILSFKKKTRWTLTIEVLIYFILLLPLVNIFVRFSFDWFNYFLFLFPISLFIITYPLSVFYSYREYKKKNGLGRNASSKLLE